jgi:hypothetical protein
VENIEPASTRKSAHAWVDIILHEIDIALDTNDATLHPPMPVTIEPVATESDLTDEQRP